MTTNNLVQKIWSFCDTLRDDGLGYNDYLEQLTYLLFRWRMKIQASIISLKYVIGVIL